MISSNLNLNIIKGTNPTLASISVLLLRCTVGILLFMSGSGKIFGWFGGYGMEATLQGYAKMGFSSPLAHISMFTEFFGGLLLVAGLLTRPAAFAVMINMLIATIVSLPAVCSNSTRSFEVRRLKLSNSAYNRKYLSLANANSSFNLSSVDLADPVSG